MVEFGTSAQLQQFSCRLRGYDGWSSCQVGFWIIMDGVRF